MKGIKSRHISVPEQDSYNEKSVIVTCLLSYCIYTHHKISKGGIYLFIYIGAGRKNVCVYSVYISQHIYK